MKKCFITFDMDWASDEVLEEVYSILCNLDIQYTMNVTHDTEFLDILRKDHRVELGIHPNFNKLLLGDRNAQSINSIISDLMYIVPEAVTTRSHSIVTGSIISNELANVGINNDLNIYYQPQCGDHIGWYKDVFGINKIPFFFEDDVYMMYKEKKGLDFYFSDEYSAPRIFNFHPIHIFLNSEDMKRYEYARPYLQDFSKLKAYINREEKTGSKVWLEKIISLAKEAGYTFCKIKDGEWNESCHIRQN